MYHDKNVTYHETDMLPVGARIKLTNVAPVYPPATSQRFGQNPKAAEQDQMQGQQKQQQNHTEEDATAGGVVEPFDERHNGRLAAAALSCKPHPRHPDSL